MARKPNAAALAAVVLPALFLTIVSAASLAGALTALPADATIAALRNHDAPPPPPAELEDAARMQSRAARWFEPARHATAAASAIGLLPYRQRDHLAADLNGEALVRRALASDPGSSINWSRLAIYRLDAGDKAGGSKAWQMSVLTGRYVPGLMTSRLLIGFRMFPTYDQALLDLLKDQVRVSAEADGRELARAAMLGYGEPFIRAVLGDQPALLINFESGLLYEQWLDRNRAERLGERAAEARRQAGRRVAG